MLARLFGGILGCLLAAATLTGAAAGGNWEFTVTVNGESRAYLAHVPDSDSEQRAYPVVLVLHGAGGSKEHTMATQHWGRQADSAGFIAVSVEAEPVFRHRPARFRDNPRVWNDGSGRGAQGRRDAPDLAYIDAVLDDVARRYRVDRRRIFAAGHSNGAAMARRLGLERSGRIAAIAGVAGDLFVDSRPKRPVPALFIVGRADPLAPWDGGEVRLPWGGRAQRAPFREIPARWAKLSGCAGEPRKSETRPGLTRLDWPDCAVEIILYGVAEAGHSWPGGTPSRLPAAMVGPYSDRIDATALVWKFFARNPLSD